MEKELATLDRYVAPAYSISWPKLRLDGCTIGLEDFAALVSMSKRTAQRRAKAWVKLGVTGVSLEPSGKSKIKRLAYHFTRDFVERYKLGVV